MGDILTNPISALEVDDTAFLKIQAAETYLAEVTEAVGSIENIRKAIRLNDNAYEWERRNDQLVEITIRVESHTAVNIINEVKSGLEQLLKAAEARLEAL